MKRHPEGTRRLITMAGEEGFEGALTGNTTEVVFLLYSPRTKLPYQRYHPQTLYSTLPLAIIIDSDDADETALVATPALREPFVPHSAILTAPSTPPEQVEVWP
ncbi:hypothetical protein ES707_04045 [subsurface metagenome]